MNCVDTQKRQAFEHILRNQNVTLVELLDHLLLKGVMAKGEIVLTVADVDLVYLNLGLLLSSVQTVVSAAGDAQPVWRTDLVDQQAPLSVEPPAPTLPGEKVEGFPHSQSQPFVPRYEPPTAESEQPEQEEHARK